MPMAFSPELSIQAGAHDEGDFAPAWISEIICHEVADIPSTRDIPTRGLGNGINLDKLPSRSLFSFVCGRNQHISLRPSVSGLPV